MDRFIKFFVYLGLEPKAIKATDRSDRLVRSQFWDAQDLHDFRREVRQRGETVFEYTWRSFKPTDPTKTNDLTFTTRYKLFDGGDGQMYQLCKNLGMEEILNR